MSTSLCRFKPQAVMAVPTRSATKENFMSSLRFLLIVFTAVLSLPALAQYPNKPIKIVVPYPPGGSTDVVARLIGQKLQETWKQPVVVENRAGASGMIGTDIVAKSAPDGYTLLLAASGPQAVNISLFPKIPYDPVKDFAPITLVVSLPLLMVAPTSLPANNAREFIAWARDNKDKANYCSIGPGTPSHLAGELFKSMTGADVAHIPYKGSGPALIDTMGGVCSVLFDSALSSGPHVKSGKLKVLATGSKARLGSWPDVPTLAESGLPGYEAYTWGALVAPAGTPRDIVARLQAEVSRILALPDVKQKLEAQGAIPEGGSSEQLATFIQAEIGKWAKVIKDGNIKAD